MKTVSIIGLGYIGLPTALIAAQNGFLVYGYDIDHDRITRINTGDPVIHEPDIEHRLQTVLKEGTFYASSVLQASDVIIIAVPTPIMLDKTADLSAVFSAAEAITKILQKNTLIILESTVPVGTTERLAAYIAAKTGLLVGKDFYCAHCPERVLPGNIFQELLVNNRIIGGVEHACMQKARDFYKHFVQGALYLTTARMAELVKLTENSFRDVSLAFAHQVASMAHAADMNPYEVIELANKHPRVSILRPTSGVGGHCIAVDPWFLISTYPEQAKLLHTARVINDQRPFELLERVRQFYNAWNNIHNKTCTIALLGLTYKPNVDDTRESPAVTIAQQIALWKNCNVLVVDPHVPHDKISQLTSATAVSCKLCLESADIVICLVAHNEFKQYIFDLKEHKYVLDFCGLLYEEHKVDHQQEYVFWSASYNAQKYTHQELQ